MKTKWSRRTSVQPVVGDTAALEDEVLTLRHETKLLREAIALQGEVLARLSTMTAGVAEGQGELQGSFVEVAQVLAASVGGRVSADDHAAALGRTLEYRVLVQRLRVWLRRLLPSDAVVVVVTKGDDRLLDLDGRTAWHFPQALDGGWAGHHPATSLAAIVQLEALRARGATHLVVPAPMRWWLDHYGEFAARLRDRYRCVADADEAVVFVLTDDALHPDTAAPRLADTLEECRRHLRRSPSVLDWCGGALVSEAIGANVFVPPADGTPLPYVDNSIDVVVVPAAAPSGVRAEADRVSSTLVITRADDGSLAEVAWKAQPEPRADLSVDIVVSGLDTEARDATLAAVDRARAIVADRRSTSVESERRHGEYVVFVDGGLVPIDDWLEPLVTPLTTDASLAAVGGRLLGFDGTLAGAGGVLFRDGSIGGLGQRDAAVDAPEYQFARDADVLSAGFLAVRNDALVSVGGLDDAYSSPWFAGADLCLRLRSAGYRTMYQPRSTAVACGLGCSPPMSELEAADQSRFTRRWADVLPRCSPRPATFDTDTWRALATAPSVEVAS